MSYLKTVVLLISILLSSSGCAKLAVNMIGAPLLDTMILEINDSESYRLALEGLPANILSASAAA